MPESDRGKTLGHYDLSIPAKGIDCTLTYERYGMSLKDLTIVYDRRILSGNQAGTNAANEALDVIYNDIREDFDYYKIYITPIRSPQISIIICGWKWAVNPFF